MTGTTKPQTLGEVDQPTCVKLRDVLCRCHRDFQVYKGYFEKAGISERDISEADPLEMLQSLPLMDADTFLRLTDESLQVGSSIIDMETSSGTTGQRKRRFISYQDDIAETEFLAELFRTCGIGSLERVACLDTDPLTLMVSFTKALDLLGVQEAYAFCVGNDYRRMLEQLPRLDPTTIIAVPSLIERCLESLKEFYGGAHFPSLNKVVYVGERLPVSTRKALECDLGVEVFGYYGASETSALGIECASHDGIHLFTDHNIIEFVTGDPESQRGEIVVTTLNQETLPLLRYPLRDEIAVKSGTCACGRGYPRVDVIGRVGDTVSILGAKISYNAILNTVYKNAQEPGPMHMTLTRDSQERLIIKLPHKLKARESEFRQAIIKSQSDLDFLTGSKFLRLDFAFVEEDTFLSDRKAKKIVDMREQSI